MPEEMEKSNLSQLCSDSSTVVMMLASCVSVLFYINTMAVTADKGAGVCGHMKSTLTYNPPCASPYHNTTILCLYSVTDEHINPKVIWTAHSATC